MKLPAAAEARRAATFEELRLPDVKERGARIFLRVEGRRNVIVEAVEMTPEQRAALDFPAAEREVEARLLSSLLVQLYPPAIRAVEQQKSFKKVEGTLKLRPAGSDGASRAALLSGPVRLANEAGDSTFEGTLELALSYAPDGAAARSFRGVAEGTFHYAVNRERRGEMKLTAAFESRP